jgi:hypothetical protein
LQHTIPVILKDAFLPDRAPDIDKAMANAVALRAFSTSRNAALVSRFRRGTLKGIRVATEQFY